MAKKKRKNTRDTRISGLLPDKARGNMRIASGPNVVKSGTITLPPGTIPSPSGGKSSAFDFSQALLQGHPAAMEAARHALNFEGKPEDEASLADKFVSSSYEWAKYFRFNAKEEKAVVPVVMAYRQAMRQAQRFVLDDDFTRYATEVSNNTKAEKLLYRLQYCTLPYDKTWIEFRPAYQGADDAAVSWVGRRAAECVKTDGVAARTGR